MQLFSSPITTTTISVICRRWRYPNPDGEAGHMTPALLKDELVSFRTLKGYLPRVVTVHANPTMEGKITAELLKVAGELGCSITPGCEGMEFET